MRNRFIKLLPIGVCLILVNSCQKEMTPSHEVLNADQISIDLRDSEKIPVCHNKGKSGYDIIYVDDNALDGHLKHGDFLLTDLDGDGFFAGNTPCVDLVDCNDKDHEVTEGQNCDGTGCCFCPYAEDIPWQIYVNVSDELGFPFKGTQLILGNPAAGGYTVQVVYNLNFPNQWECLIVNPDIPLVSVVPITAEQAMICRNVLCQIASDLGLVNVLGLQSSTGELRSTSDFEFYKMAPQQ